MATKSPIIFAPLLLAAACSSGMISDGAGTGGGGGNPGGGDGTPESVAQISGTYEVTSTFDLRNSPDVPPIVSDALGPLSNLSDNPAGAILDGTGLADLLNGAPAFVRTLVEGQLNNYINNKLYQGTPVAQKIADYTDMIASMLTNFEVVTSLEVGKGDAAGNANADHRLTGIAFMQDGNRHLVTTPDIINALTAAQNVSVNIDLGASTINLGDHALTLPLGDFAVTAFHQALESQFGITDLGAELNSMVDCTALATNVGPIDAFGFTIVTETQLAAFCVQGINQAAAQVDVQIRRLDQAQVHFTGGDGTVTMGAKADSAGVSQLSTMTGKWQSEFSINSAAFALPSDFKAVRKN